MYSWSIETVHIYVLRYLVGDAYFRRNQATAYFKLHCILCILPAVDFLHVYTHYYRPCMMWQCYNSSVKTYSIHRPSAQCLWSCLYLQARYQQVIKTVHLCIQSSVSVWMRKLPLPVMEKTQTCATKGCSLLKSHAASVTTLMSLPGKSLRQHSNSNINVPE